MKCLMVLMLIITVETQDSTTNILYVMSDNSIDTNCSFHPCATLSQYLSDNGTLPVVVNVEYHFLPGEHQVPDNIVLNDLHNFSIIGVVNKSSSSVVFIGCFHSYIFKILASRNVVIRNVMFKRCYSNIPQLQYPYLTSLYISECFSCAIKNVTFKNFGIVGENLIGESILNEIYITHAMATGQFCQGITLMYRHQNQLLTNVYHLLINKLYITGVYSNSKCYSFGDYLIAGIFIYISGNTKTATVTISNSLFKLIHGTAVYFRNNCVTKATFLLHNCIFHSIAATNEPVVQAVLSTYNNYISIKNCTYRHNYADDSLVSIQIRLKVDIICRFGFNNQFPKTLSSIFFKENYFKLNSGVILLFSGTGGIDRVTLNMIGPINITHNWTNTKNRGDLMSIENMTIHMYGPVTVSYNDAAENSVLKLASCEVTFYDEIYFKSNFCFQIVYLIGTQPYIKVMEYANITFIHNKCNEKLIQVQSSNFNHDYCLFQFMISNNQSRITPNDYNINIIKTLTEQKKECSFIYYHINPSCQWLPTAAFQGHDSKIVNHQIIQIDEEQINYHRICLCYENGSYNCSNDVLGTVYPGQVLQVGLCTPCSNSTFILYAETYESLQTNLSCKITNKAEILNTINSTYTKLINYTIISEAHEMCKLILIISSYAYEVFYVKLRSCPVGFTLQDGACNCDPILKKYIDKCYIDHSAIRRPANTWIIAQEQSNSTKYLISFCPMDYCLPHTSNINLLYPDLQCQFNRTGILCSQCHQHLSMVFASSRCMRCTNTYILITIIVIVAGIVLVVLLYLLNLTVTKGTINGMILYANIISINDSIFLINTNIFGPLKVFISFANLDLGIETCFYDGMDSYAKKWLNLFFPFYLIIIAVFIVVASRYSSRILRLTYTRSLPVLATLFLLSYTGVLRTVLTVLFSYSTITHLPSGHKQTVWSIDASVQLFELKFTILFIACILLFLLLIPFNITLLFTRFLSSKFRIINQFKPVLDAFQGPYKDRYYYWVAVNLILRSIFFALYGFESKLRLFIATLILIIFTIYHGYIKPNKNKVVNIQELLLLINLTILYAASYYGSGSIFPVITNVMISLAFVQFVSIVLYHFLSYTCHCDVVTALRTLRENAMRICRKRLDDYLNDIALLVIDKNTHNYNEYQDN